jgi:hypothetical protein
MRRTFLSLSCIGLAGCHPFVETLHSSATPLTLEAARRDPWISSLPFPDSATDFHYVDHVGGMQEFDFFVRFTVDPKDLKTPSTTSFRITIKRLTLTILTPRFPLPTRRHRQTNLSPCPRQGGIPIPSRTDTTAAAQATNLFTFGSIPISTPFIFAKPIDAARLF